MDADTATPLALGARNRCAVRLEKMKQNVKVSSATGKSRNRPVMRRKTREAAQRKTM
jgi:hypothetical protein